MVPKNVYVAQQAKEYDAIVVGSGITGGYAAKELCELGLETLVLERGRNVEHGTDYVTEHKQTWDFPARNSSDSQRYKDEYEVQRRCYAFGEHSSHFFINDKENPYIAVKPFSWIRGDQVGGRSLMWGRQCYRWGEVDFEANARDGHGVDWPIRYADIAPWYDYVEQFVGISGQAEGVENCPDGVFLPPMPLNKGELVTKERMAKVFSDRLLTIGRVAVLTQAHNGRGPCHYCGPCHRGCSVGAYFSSLSATLPAAEATGNLTLQPNSIVHSIIYDQEKGRATGVRYVDRATKEVREVYGKIVFLCASAISTAQIMLHSTSNRFPNGFSNDSGALGHYLMDHPYLAGATGDVPNRDDKYYFGNRPNGIYILRHRNLDPKKPHPNFLRGYGYQGSASRAGWNRGIQTPGFGADFKHGLRKPGPWSMWIGGWGEHLPRYENYVALDPEAKDAWGIPALRIHCTWSDNERKMKQDMAEQGAEMLEAAGCTNVQPFNNDAPPGFCIHEMGTARMGRDPKTSVLNAYNQAHDVPNLFVTDGACMTSSACQNPSLTYMALTTRAVDYAVGELQRRNL